MKLSIITLLEVYGINNNCFGETRPIDDRLPGYARWQQVMYDRYDALDEACFSLRSAIDALRACDRPSGEAEHPDDMAALEEIAAGLARDRDAVSAKLKRLEALDRAALEREYRSQVL